MDTRLIRSGMTEEGTELGVEECKGSHPPDPRLSNDQIFKYSNDQSRAWTYCTSVGAGAALIAVAHGATEETHDPHVVVVDEAVSN